jgi:hypothetical protein
MYHPGWHLPFWHQWDLTYNGSDIAGPLVRSQDVSEATTHWTHSMVELTPPEKSWICPAHHGTVNLLWVHSDCLEQHSMACVVSSGGHDRRTQVSEQIVVHFLSSKCSVNMAKLFLVFLVDIAKLILDSLFGQGGGWWLQIWILEFLKYLLYLYNKPCLNFYNFESVTICVAQDDIYPFGFTSNAFSIKRKMVWLKTLAQK